MGTIKYLVLIVFMVVLLSQFGLRWGVVGIIIAFIIIGTIRIVMGWRQFILGLQYIETKVWGKPLDKIHWQNKPTGKRLPKIKIKWGRKK